ncbi:PREDICTED: uncharacterized protein LOC106813471 [Priapulus caudatus]|uniref:Uncharacterized protein LOC106813471 n=1 Tax=Priapulus caudatus TaxID=37621 RepID=A0ABM1ELM3_PRICU|nr:PREDICTED: uncharacterized protein LOC106813471 [Priapulus caudatus]
MVLEAGLPSHLVAAASPEAELRLLEALQSQLLPPPRESLEDDFLEQQWLAIASSNADDNPFVGHSLVEFFSDAESLQTFTCYVFNRRYGWSEAGSPQRRRSVPQKTKLKTSLNELLDELIKWYMYQELSSPLLESMKASVIAASKKPVVRNQTLVHCMEWFKLNAHSHVSGQYYSLVKEIVLLGLMDVWSAVRNACCCRLPDIVGELSLAELEDLFTDLVLVCEGRSSTWQAVEGAVMGSRIRY